MQSIILLKRNSIVRSSQLERKEFESSFSKVAKVLIFIQSSIYRRLASTALGTEETEATQDRKDPCRARVYYNK